MTHAEPAPNQWQLGEDAPKVIVLDNAATLTQGGTGSSTEDKRYQYG